MYLIVQLWWLLLLAFLLGALIGYTIWRACGRRELLASFERQNKDIKNRLAALQHERDRFKMAALEAEKDAAQLAGALSKRPQSAAPVQP